MYVVTVQFQIHSDHIKDFRGAVLTQAENSLELEPDCHRFDVCLDLESSGIFFLYEIYSNATAFEEHLASNHFLNFDKVVKPWITNKSVNCWTLES
ncbi:MAG: antibiotic biosynthesis monooxygenase [Blastopirellula sp.]|nr:MAG: antibiotic biosynthesis monooxygenase [Blastopirellula sp.]